jgi:hypothetical protein
MLELDKKQEINAILSNEILISLLRDKRYDIDERTTLEIEGNLNFSLSYENSKLIVIMNDIRPKLTIKRFLKFHGRISKISIGVDDILISIDNLPDLKIILI